MIASKTYYRDVMNIVLDYLPNDDYRDEAQLRTDVAELIDSQDMTYVLERIKNVLGVAPTIELTPQRFRLCRGCGTPFIAFDSFNQQRFCHDLYREHNIINGQPKVMALKGWSSCAVAQERLRMRANRKGNSNEES